MSELKAGKRVVITAFGQTPLESIERNLVLEDQPAPQPSELAPDDVVIAVRSAAVGWVDLIMTSGQYQHMPALPYTPGLEYAGDVVLVGSAVDSVSVGDAVLADGLLTGPRSKSSRQRYGGFATYAIAPAHAVRPLPKGFSYDHASNFLGNYETAYHCLFHRGQLRAGETVLIHGASGSTGLAAVHLAKIAGATVIATGRSKDKLEAVRAQGADHVVDTSEAEGGIATMAERVKALTGGQGVDAVYDGVGGDISVASLRCMKFGARFLIVGWASTPFVSKGQGQRGAPNANVLPTNLIMMKGLTVMGCPAIISTERDPSIRVKRLADLTAWVEQGRIKPVVAASFPLGDIREAMLAKWNSKHVGGIVVQP